MILQLRNWGVNGGPSDLGAADANPLVDQGGVAATRFDTRKMDAVLMIVIFSVDIVCRTGSVKCLRKTGSVKSVILPSEQVSACETSCCGKLLKLDSTTPTGKLVGGTRLMAVPKGNNLSRYMDNPQAYQLSPLWKDMLGSQRLNGCRSTMKDDQSRVGLRYSPAMRESVWIH